MKKIELIPYENNPRQISDSEFEMLGKSMSLFGDLGGIVLNKRDSYLISGHQRVKSILERYGSYEVEITGKNMAGENIGIVKAGKEEINYREVDWPEEMSIPARLAANKIQGDWLQEKLDVELQQVLDMDIDLDLTGFDIDDINPSIDLSGYDGINDSNDKYYIILEVGQTDYQTFMPKLDETLRRFPNIKSHVKDSI